MADADIKRILMDRLSNGFTHPGDPERDIPPTPILLPFKARQGQPEEMTKLLSRTAELLAECIISTIENDGQSDILPRAEAKTLRRNAGVQGPARVALVHCRCDRSRNDPLVALSVSEDPDAFVVDGGALLRGMHRRGVKCPHTLDDTTSDAEILRDELVELLDGLPARMVTKKARALIEEKMAGYLA